MREERHAITSVLLCKTSVAGVALSKAIQTCKNLQAVFCTLAWLSAWLMPNAQKKSPLHTVHVQRANVSRYHLFLCFFLAYLRDLLTGIGRAGLLSKFSLSVQKLPSIPAFLQIPLSLSGISLSAVPGYVLLFLTTFVLFRYSLYHSRGFFICQGGVSLTPPQKLSPALSLSLQYRPRSRLFPAGSSAEKGMMTVPGFTPRPVRTSFNCF